MYFLKHIRNNVSLFQELDSSKQEIDSYRQEIYSSKQEVDSYKQEIDSYNQEIDSSKQEVDSSNQELYCYFIFVCLVLHFFQISSKSILTHATRRKQIR